MTCSGGKLNSGECSWNDIGKTGEPREKSLKPQLVHLNLPPGYSETQTRKPSRDRRAIYPFDILNRRNNHAWNPDVHHTWNGENSHATLACYYEVRFGVKSG